MHCDCMIHGGDTWCNWRVNDKIQDCLPVLLLFIKWSDWRDLWLAIHACTFKVTMTQLLLWLCLICNILYVCIFIDQWIISIVWVGMWRRQNHQTCMRNTSAVFSLAILIWRGGNSSLPTSTLISFTLKTWTLSRHLRPKDEQRNRQYRWTRLL